MTQIGSAYGEALYSLAKEDGLSGDILKELEALETSFAQEPDYLRLLASPNLTKEERCGILDTAFRGKVHVYVLNFLKLLTERGRIRQFGECADAYRELYNQENNILPVTAVSAVPLSEEQAARLTEKMTRLTGKTIALTNRVDASVLGGMRLDYDGKRVDDTIAHRMDSLRDLLRNTVL